MESHIQEVSVMEAVLSPEEVQAALLKALAHPFRIRLLDVLSEDEECVCHLSALFDKPQPYVSQQLAALKEAGLVVDRRAAQRIFYRSADARIASLLDMARSLVGGSKELLQFRAPVPGCSCPKCDPDAQ
jgi:DNA-binding transcriptional ArsR family regulator